MGSSDFELDTTSLVDTTASYFSPIYGKLDDGGDFQEVPPLILWQGAQIKLRAGRQKNTATICIPLLSVDETGPTVCGITDSPLEDMVYGTPWKIVQIDPDGNSSILFSGVQVDKNLETKEDCAVITCECQKHDLEGVSVYGQLFYSNGDMIYRRSARCIMNYRGQPNMTVDSDGNPLFCAPWLGLAQGEAPPETPVEGKASYWTPPFSFKYMFNLYNNEDIAALILETYPAFQMVPSSIVWADGLEAALTEVNEDGTSSVRKHAQLDNEAKNLFEVLSNICDESGPFCLFMDPNEDGFTSNLQIIRYRYNATGPVGIYRSTSGDIVDATGPVAVSCTLNESGKNTFTKVTISGLPIAIETTLSTVDGSLLWVDETDSEFTKWKQFITDQIAANHYTFKDILQWANNLYPTAVQALKINPDPDEFDFQMGTTEEGSPLAYAPREFLEHLLSSYLTGGSTEADRNNNTYPIRFEYSRDGGANWFACPADSGMSVDDNDWSIWVEPLSTKLDLTQQGFTWTGSSANANAIVRTDIRVTLAVMCDHPISSSYRITCDPSEGVDILDGTFTDTDKIQQGYSRHYYADSELYAYEIVHNSIVPMGAGAADNAPTSFIARDDTKYSDNHGKRRLEDVGRLAKADTYNFPHVFNQFRPGTQIDNLCNLDDTGQINDTYRRGVVIHEVHFTAEHGKNTTAVIAG